MSNLATLISELCPKGVPFVPLWSVTVWDKKFNNVSRNKQPVIEDYKYLLAKDLFSMEAENGDVFLLSTGEQTGWTTEIIAGGYLKEGEVVTIPWGKSRKVTECIKYYKGKFVTADNRIATSSNPEILNNKFLYYWIMSVGDTIDSFYRGSGIKHPDMSKVLDLQIPLPPLEVQAEIVRILNNFTELTAELTAELSERKKQFDYYRDLLLLSEGKGFPLEKLGDCCEIGDGLHSTPNYSENENYYFINGNNLSDGIISFDRKTKTVSKKEYEKYKINLSRKTILMSINGTIGKVAFYKGEKVILGKSVAFFNITSDELDSHYLYHYLQCGRAREYYKASLTGNAILNLGLKALRNFEIPLPPLSRQVDIANMLDSYSNYCSDIYDGLPAEIVARQKQYDYYRDKLLTFQKLKQ